MRGPVAPKDPVKKRPCLYVILDKLISARKEDDGKCYEHIYLEGRLEGQVKFTSGDIDDEILSLLKSVKGFRKLVHSVGITIKAEEEFHNEEAMFALQCYGKTDKYTTGTNMKKAVPCTGEEVLLDVDSYPDREEDTVVGAFHIELPFENKNVIITVKFYLNDGYDVPEIQVDPPVQFDTREYKKMISNSLVSTGNNYRLKKVIERTKAGDEVTIAYIGGSITQGAGAKPIHTECYAYRSYDAFCKLFSPCNGNNVHYVKAGVGGTSSELGMIRYDRDVRQDGKITPDLVIVEYAVNDEGDETRGVCFESLVKKILEADNQPAVLLMFSVFMDDYNLQERLQPIGERYQLPMVSVKDAVVPQFKDNKVITKRQYFYDIYHPTNLGHRIMADCIQHLYETVNQEVSATNDISLDLEPVYGTRFKDIVRFDRRDADAFAKITTCGFDKKDLQIQWVERNMDLELSPVFEDNWKNEGTKDAFFQMDIRCKKLLVVMKDSGDSSFGKVDVFVDGKFLKTLDPLVVGWNHSTALIIVDQTETAEHEICFKMHPQDEDKCFTIQGFGVIQ